MTQTNDIEQLAAQLMAAVLRLDPREQSVALALVRMLSHGEPVSEHDWLASWVFLTGRSARQCGRGRVYSATSVTGSSGSWD